jgi:hypothetical protein
MSLKNVAQVVKRVVGWEDELAQFRRDLDDDRMQDDRLLGEHNALLQATTTRADVELHIRQQVMARRAELIARDGAEIANSSGGTLLWGDGPVRPTVPTFPAVLLSYPAVDVLCFTDPERLIAAVVAVASPDGLTVRQRLQRCAEIDRERKQIAERHAAKVDQARALGLEVPHMPATVARRLAEKAAAEREAHERADADYHARLANRP